jgi:4'-phosphopantetheinyl transferase EntD
MAKGQEGAVLAQTGPDLYPLAFRLEERFGTCVGVHLTGAHSIEPAALLRSLHPDEQALCRSMKGARLVEWVGGRHASRLARIGMNGAGSPTLATSSGAPEVAEGVKISISHTQTLAVALASADSGYAIGVDVEAVATDTLGEELLAERIMSPAEFDGSLSRGPDIETVQRLSIKEAVYKAAFALTGAHLPLRQISVERHEDGGAQFRILVPVETMRVEAMSFRVEEHFLSLASLKLS